MSFKLRSRRIVPMCTGCRGTLRNLSYEHIVRATLEVIFRARDLSVYNFLKLNLLTCRD